MSSYPPIFSANQLDHLEAERTQAGDGSQLSAGDILRLIARWKPVVRPIRRYEEPFDLVTSAGECTGVVAPRWLCHLMGLCHRTVHLVLRTPQEWLVLQMRSPRVDWPGLLDLSVTGHVRAGLTWEQAIQAEAAEELGLDLATAAGMLAPASLAAVGDPYLRCEADSVNPPVHICHVTQIFAATLTPLGLAGLRFADGEVAGLYLCSLVEAIRLMTDEPERVAPGLAQSLPWYVEAVSGVARPVSSVGS
jgi:isopentenyldiphosphate isomerase